MQLPAAERVDLAMALWDSLTPAEQEAEFELTSEQRVELDRRLAEHIADPVSAIPREEVRRSEQGRKLRSSQGATGQCRLASLGRGSHLVYANK